MGTWDSSYEAAPADLDKAGLGDDAIRELKTEIGDRGDIEHVWRGATDGRHRLGSARPYYASTEPVGGGETPALAQGRLWLNTASSRYALHVYDGAAWRALNGCTSSWYVPTTLTVDGTTTLAAVSVTALTVSVSATITGFLKVGASGTQITEMKLG